MRRSMFAVAVLMAALALPTWIAANNINTGGQLGVAHCLTSKTLGFTGINLGGGFKYERDYDYVDDLAGTDVGRSSPNLFSGNIFANYGLLSPWHATTPSSARPSTAV